MPVIESLWFRLAGGGSEKWNNGGIYDEFESMDFVKMRIVMIKKGLGKKLHGKNPLNFR